MGWVGRHNARIMGDLSGRNAMKCEFCGRKLAEGEPVYQRLLNRRWFMMCAKCEAGLNDKSPRIYSLRSCCHCTRPIYLTEPLRRSTRYVVCGPKCRQAVHNTKYRLRHQRPRMAQCADCGKSFMPKRSDAKFCSAACKQRAYHHRIKPTASGPTRFDRRGLGEN